MMQIAYFNTYTTSTPEPELFSAERFQYCEGYSELLKNFSLIDYLCTFFSRAK